MIKLKSLLSEVVRLQSINLVNDTVKKDLAAAAQKVYDDWEQDENGMNWELGAGGICHLIADELVDVLYKHNISDVQTVCSTHEQHVYVVGRFREGIHMIDIPYSYYETGGGYTWKKKTNIVFDESHIEVVPLDRNPRNLKLYVNENEEEQEPVDKDRLFWNQSYLDDLAEKFGYDDDFNKKFWSFPRTLYHMTPKENLESIRVNGLKRKNQTRGLSNRGTPPAIFTTAEEEEVTHLQHSYGEVIVAINSRQMKADGFMPFVSQEPEWEHGEKLAFVMGKLGEDDDVSRYVDSSDGTTQNTIIVYDNIPPKYLSIEHD